MVDDLELTWVCRMWQARVNCTVQSCITGTKGLQVLSRHYRCVSALRHNVIWCLALSLAFPHYYIDWFVDKPRNTKIDQKAISGARHACKLALKVSLSVSKVYSRSWFYKREWKKTIFNNPLSPNSIFSHLQNRWNIQNRLIWRWKDAEKNKKKRGFLKQMYKRDKESI